MLPRTVAWSVVIVATLTMTVSYIDRTTLSVLGPSVTDALDISDWTFGLLTSAFSIAYLVATPLAGRWIDRVGARRGLVVSLLVWSSIAGLHALVPGIATLFALRIGLGLAEGPSFPGAAQTVQRVLPARERARGFGMLFTGSSIGAMIAPPLAGALYSIDHSWRVAFLGTAIIGLAWIPLWIALVRRPDVRAAIDRPVAATAPRPTFDALLRQPAMQRALVGVFAAAPGLGFFTYWGAKYLVKTHHLTQGQVGHYLWVPPLFLDAGALLFGDLASRIPRAPGAPPRALYAVAMLLATSIGLLPLVETPWQAMMIGSIAYAGGGALYTLCTADLLSRMEPQAVAFAGGMLAGAQSLAFIITNPLIGLAVDHFGDYRAVAIALAIWVVPGSLIWIAWRPDALKSNV